MSTSRRDFVRLAGAVGARRISVATACTDAATGRLTVSLEEHGFDVLVTKGLGMRDANPRVYGFGMVFSRA
jgi:maleate cis-trans isomerase